MSRVNKELPREPMVKNKYNIKVADICNMVLVDKESIKKSPFWRNSAIGAWCLSGCVRPYPKDTYGTFDLDYWIGVYDSSAKAYAGKIKVSCSSYGGMCHYDFKEFYNPREIDGVYDLILQEKLLERVNWLLDNKIFKLRNK